MADFSELNWGPVENVRHDLGVDVYLQVRDERRFDRVALVMAQVKSGASCFANEAKGESGDVTGWWYAEADAKHFENWVQHGSPHLLVLHDPATRISYWAHVTEEAVTSTGDGFKIFVPVTQRVDGANLEALLRVAASAKNSLALQGTSFRASAKAVAPGRALRHALLAPRLIAPHPNTGHKRTLEPEEAVALLTQGRMSDLHWFVQENRNPKLAGAAATSRDWGWRFFAAHRELVTTGDRRPILELATATMRRWKQKKEQAYRIGACAVTAAVALIDAEFWDEAQAVLLEAGEDLPPVDHAWVLVHRAVVLAERGNVEVARSLAATAQRTVNLDADDVTAGAIGAAAASLIFATGAWGLEEFTEALTAGDTAASWWRSQTVSWALGDHDQGVFKAWADCEDVGAQYLDNAQNRLHGAGLAASLAGDRASAAAALAVRAHHELIHHEVAWRSATASELDNAVDHTGTELADVPPGTAVDGPKATVNAGQDAANGLEGALDELRRYGRHKDLEIAARRLWAAGPAAPVRAALWRSAAAPWTHTNAHAKLTLLYRAGDLLDTRSADEAVHHCLNVLIDPTPFAEQVRPSFSVTHYVHQALRGVLAAASDAAHDHVVEHLLQRVANGDDLALEDDLLPLIACMRPLAVTARAERVRTAALNHRSARISAAMLGALLAGDDRDAESELMRRADDGDRNAVAALGSATALSSVAAAALIERDAAGCRQLIAQARKGSHRLGGWDSPRALTVANLTFPALARWEPVVEAILDPLVAQDHKINAVHILAVRADDLPDEVASSLREAMSSGVTGVRVEGFSQSREGLVAAAFALGLALGVLDTAAAVRRILSWLRGSAAQRRAAGGLLGVLGRRAQDPVIQGSLVMLASDQQYHVRAAAAAALVRGATSPVADVVEEAVVIAARETGCAVPLSVGQTLQAAPEVWPRLDTVRAELAVHISARVRAAADAAEHEPNSRANER